jgi:hypothetical protein
VVHRHHAAMVLVWRGTLAMQAKPLPGKWWRVGCWR